LAELPWEQIRSEVNVKLLAHEGELYVQAQSQNRISKSNGGFEGGSSGGGGSAGLGGVN
jgi:hypothetical protein